LNIISDFIEDFVLPSSRPRLYYLLSKPERRHEVLRHFDSGLFDPRFRRPIEQRKPAAHDIYALMRALGAPSKCIILSMDSPAEEVDLLTALEECHGYKETPITTIYCPKAKVGYWQGDNANRWLLSKNKANSHPPDNSRRV
jgi:hypothetical protein